MGRKRTVVGIWAKEENAKRQAEALVSKFQDVSVRPGIARAGRYQRMYEGQHGRLVSFPKDTKVYRVFVR